MARRPKTGAGGGAESVSPAATTPKTPAAPTAEPKPQVDKSAEQPKATREIAKWTRRAVAIIFGICLVRLLLAWLGWWPITSERPRPVAEATQHYQQPQTLPASVAFADTFVMGLTHPFYWTVPFDLKPGDLIEINAWGKGAWEPLFTIPRGDVVTPDGWDKRPKAFPAVLRREWKFRKEDAPIASLLAAIGSLDYLEPNIPTLIGTPHYFVGSHGFLTVPEGLEQPKLQLCMNEKWLLSEFKDNSGTWTIGVIVRRGV